MNFHCSIKVVSLWTAVYQIRYHNKNHLYCIFEVKFRKTRFLTVQNISYPLSDRHFITAYPKPSFLTGYGLSKRRLYENSCCHFVILFSTSLSLLLFDTNKQVDMQNIRTHNAYYYFFVTTDLHFFVCSTRAITLSSLSIYIHPSVGINYL